MAEKVDKKICRKLQGLAEPGNTCLQTPGTCESCPEWGTEKDVRAFRLNNMVCGCCGKRHSRRKYKAPAPIFLSIGKLQTPLCMKCAKSVSNKLDAVIEKIENGYVPKAGKQ